MRLEQSHPDKYELMHNPIKKALHKTIYQIHMKLLQVHIAKSHLHTQTHRAYWVSTMPTQAIYKGVKYCS